MDCLGKEVTSKMKSAIMAKLMELGISADEDLLDYIMLMISNKRSKAGMNRDLSLFLGANTVPFVTWLHQVLSKLQEVTISTQVTQSKPKKTDNVPSGKTHENLEAKLPDNVKCKKRERTPSGDDQDYLNIRVDTETDPIDDLQSVIDDSSAKSTVPATRHTEEIDTERSSSTKQVSNKAKDSKTSSDSENRKLVEEALKDEGGAKRKKISPPAKEMEKELSKDEVDMKKRRVSPPTMKEKEGVTHAYELKRRRSPPIMKEKEGVTHAYELKRRRSPPIMKEKEEVTHAYELKRRRSPPIMKEKEGVTHAYELKRRRSPPLGKEKDYELKRRRVSPSLIKESSKDDADLKIKRVSPLEKEKDIRVKDGERKSGSESGRKDKAIYDVRELLNRRKAEKSVSDDKRSREADRRKSPPPARRPVSGRERDSDREREREKERVREREKLKRSSSRELSSDRRRPPSKVVRVESSVHDVSEPRSARSIVSDRSRIRRASSSGGDSVRESDREREKETATVPSVVKVTPRPVRPSSQQPSSSLILKAMAEANKSLAKQGSTKTANTATNRTADTALRGRISPEKITVTLTNNRVQPLTKEDKENKLYVPSNGRDESYERLKQSRAMMKRAAMEDAKRRETETEMVATNGDVERTTERVVDEERNLEDDELALDIVVDPNLEYECELLEEDSSRLDREDRKRAESATNSSPRSRSLSFVSDNDKANDAVKKWLGTANVQNNRPEKSSQETDQDSEPVLEICPNATELDVEEPEFVVTLNGLNSSMYSCLSDDDEDLQQSSRFDHNFNEDLEKRNRSSNIVIEPDDANKQDSSQTEALENTQSAVLKSLDRCRYWPNCLAGDKCSFFHPTTMCKMFPACKYGDHCLFIHPPCKFGVACTRRDCAYRHPSAPLLAAKASVSVMTSSSAVTNCRFYPNCTNPTCPFFHPKPCRFGTYCTKKNCLFDHSIRHSKDKLKWIRTE